MRRSGRWGVVLLVLAVAACGDRAEEAVDGAGVEDTSPLQGWYTRADGLTEGGGELEVLRDPEGFGFRATRAGIAFREEDVRAVGPYRLQAAIQLRGGEPGDQRAFGLFVGGGNLLVDDPTWTAFLIRASGEYTIQRREGGVVTPLLEWTAFPLLRGVQSPGDVPMNILAVEIRGENVHFFLNNEEAAILPVSRVRPLGALGLRVDDGLNLTVIEWGIR